MQLESLPARPSHHVGGEQCRQTCIEDDRCP